MPTESSCPFCGKAVEDILKHFVLVHDIENLEHLDREVKKSELARKRQAKFAELVKELQDKRKKNLISAEQYRELISKWQAQDHQ